MIYTWVRVFGNTTHSLSLWEREANIVPYVYLKVG